MDARAPSHHLIKFDGGLQVSEKNHCIEAFDIHPGFQQIHGAGDECTLTRPPHGLDHVGPVVGAAHAFKRVNVLGGLFLLPAPQHIQIVHVHGHTIGMYFPGAENDDLLFGAAV